MYINSHNPGIVYGVRTLKSIIRNPEVDKVGLRPATATGVSGQWPTHKTVCPIRALPPELRRVYRQ
jgi:hypothetical protein